MAFKKLYMFNISLFILLVQKIQVNSAAEIYEMLTDEEFYRVFRSERGQVPEHELVSIDSQPVQFKSRLSSQDRFLSFTAFGRRYDLRLQLRDNVLLGKNTPIWKVRSNGSNSDIEYELLDDVLEIINGIYQDPINMVSLVELRHQKNVYYDGIVSHDLGISPLPPRIIDMVSNSSNGNNIKDHVVYKISNENSTFDDEPTAAEENVNTKFIKNNNRLKPLQVMYPEILVVVDSSYYNHFGQNPQFIINYLLPFWNGVDLRYQLLKSPEVKLNIAGIILAQDEMALNFLYNNTDETGRIHAKKALIDAGEYFSNHMRFMNSKDMVVIMTMKDICSLKYANYCKSSALGKAFTGKACSKKKNTAIFEDNGGYSGIITATHEIGHLLGMPHDGEGDAADCSMKDGFIMASAKFRSINSFCWSSCSQTLLEQFSGLTAANCLENKPDNLGGFVAQNLPGKILSIDEQCLARGGKPCMFNSTICWKLHCTRSMTNMKCIGKAPAAEGTKCGDDLHCRNGQCIPELPDIDQNNLTDIF